MDSLGGLGGLSFIRTVAIKGRWSESGVLWCFASTFVIMFCHLLGVMM